MCVFILDFALHSVLTPINSLTICLSSLGNKPKQSLLQSLRANEQYCHVFQEQAYFGYYTASILAYTSEIHMNTAKIHLMVGVWNP